MKNTLPLSWSRTPPSPASTTAPACTISPKEARTTFLTWQSDPVTSNPSTAPTVFKMKAELFHEVHRDPHHLAPAHLPSYISWKLLQPLHPLNLHSTSTNFLQPHEYVMLHLFLPPGLLLSPPLSDLLLALQRQVMKLPFWEAFSEPPPRLSWGDLAVCSQSHSPQWDSMSLSHYIITGCLTGSPATS